MSDAAREFRGVRSDGIVAPDEALVVTVDGFEGPLDLLLTLARNQKVDIAKISILKLADQYLEFIESAKKMNLELAADYLVMAAWLAYLKSRLILPQPQSADGEADRRRNGHAPALAAAAAGSDARGRGPADGARPPGPRCVRPRRCPSRSMWSSCAPTRTRSTICSRPMPPSGSRSWAARRYSPLHAPVLPIEEARERLERMLGRISDWSGLDRLLPFEWSGGSRRRSALASTLLACLELARDGKVEIRQLAPFEEIYVRDRDRNETAEEPCRECEMSTLADNDRQRKCEWTCENGDAETPVEALASTPSICGWPRRCCSRPANRWTRKRWQHRCRKARMSPSLVAELQRIV